MIETERLLLRNMCEDDYVALYAVLADSDIMQHYPMEQMLHGRVILM